MVNVGAVCLAGRVVPAFIAENVRKFVRNSVGRLVKNKILLLLIATASLVAFVPKFVRPKVSK